MGKSRYGAELLTSLKSSSVTATMDPLMQQLITEAADKGYYAFIDMSNAVDGKFIREGGSIPKLIIAKLLDLEPNSILGSVKVSDLVKYLNRVLKPATVHNPLIFQIHIDEIQTHLAPQDLWVWNSILHRLVTGFMDISLEMAKHHIFMVVVTSGSLDLSLKGKCTSVQAYYFLLTTFGRIVFKLGLSYSKACSRTSFRQGCN